MVVGNYCAYKQLPFVLTFFVSTSETNCPHRYVPIASGHLLTLTPNFSFDILSKNEIVRCNSTKRSGGWRETGGEPLERNEQHTLLILVRHLGATSDDDNDNLHIEEKANARIQHLLCRPVCQYSNGLTR
ncbi:hypothetical protein T4B_268 [Trichinella pseudospiralis]|uniref:Uncharacterized protein n=1 Tax=Trichinella pseudospiralis TaxID=6337 RepID=A0A0V1J7G1_TRIPS|nr:hypothetical protein T4B_268 [Trichinella pseudospiralis]